MLLERALDCKETLYFRERECEISQMELFYLFRLQKVFQHEYELKNKLETLKCKIGKLYRLICTKREEINF